MQLSGDQILVSTGDSLGADEYNAAGSLVRTYRAPFDVRRVRKSDLDAEIERTLAGLSATDRARAKSEVRQLRRSVQVAAHYPAGGAYDFGAPGPSVLKDDVGRVWALEYVAPGDSLAHWAVFMPDGEYLGRVLAPAAFWITNVTGSTALGVYLGPGGTQSVRAYQLEWKGAPNDSSSTPPLE